MRSRACPTAAWCARALAPALVLGALVPAAGAPCRAAAALTGAYAASLALPAGGWRLSLQLESGSQGEAEYAGLVRAETRYRSASAELVLRRAWGAGDVQWRAEAGARAARVDQERALTDVFGQRAVETTRCQAVWVSRLSLAAFRSLDRGQRAAEVASSLVLEGPPCRPPEPAAAVAVTLSEVRDPALLAGSVALTAGQAGQAALHVAGEWRVAVTEALWLSGGASLSHPVKGPGPSGRLWSGVGLGRFDGGQVEVTVEQPLGGGAFFSVRLDLVP